MADPTGTHPFSAFEWMLSLRYLRARRKEGFISVIAGFSFLGIMLGVATLIIVMAVMNGFRQELLDKILGLNGHLLIQPLESPLDRQPALQHPFRMLRVLRLAHGDRRLRPLGGVCGAPGGGDGKVAVRGQDVRPVIEDGPVEVRVCPAFCRAVAPARVRPRAARAKA